MEVELSKDETVDGWFDIKGGGRVHVKLLTPEEMREIRKACFSTKVEYPYLDVDPEKPEKGKAYKRFEAEVFDAEKMLDMVNEMSIIGWDTMVDKKTKAAIDVTPENKKLLMYPGVCPSFVEAVDGARKALKAAFEEAAKSEEKN